MRRVAIVGNAGAGKSTLARTLGRLLDLPVTHLDLLLWRPGWQPAPREDFEAAHEALLHGDAWIVDGFGSLESVARRLEFADTIIFPDYSLPRLYAWAAKRQVTSLVRPRPDFPENCPQWPKTAALFRLIAALHRDVRPDLLALVERQRATKAVYHVRSPAQMRRFLAALRARVG